MMTLTKRVMLLFIAVISSTVLTFAPLMQQTASAAVDSPVEQLERWFYYRGMRACFEKPWFGTGLTDGSDNEDISASDINDGHLKILDWNTGGEKKEGFGYLGPGMDDANGNDGTVNCQDGSIFYRGARAFGFPDVVHLICAMNKALSDPDINEGGRIEPSHPTDCVQSDEFHFDGGDSAFQSALTKALESPIAQEYGGDGDRPRIDLTDNDGPDYDAKALYYLLGKRSLEVFCGKNAPIETASEDNDSFDGDDDIVSVHVVQADGTIKKSQSYPLANSDRNESSKVNDVYWKVNGNWNEADDVTCAQMAQWTRDTGNAEAFAAYIRQHPDDFEQDNGDGGEGGSTGPVCSAGALGWVFCPLVDFISTSTQYIAGLIEDQLVYPALLNREVPEGRAIQAIWGVVLGIANVALVIAFLIVIFSQATSVGISAYGIKRMLPRVVAAAILMNLSFYICAAAVDIANIVGVSIKDIVGSGMDIVSDIQPSSNVQNGASTAQTWAAGIVGILGLGLAVATGAIFLLLPIILTALMAVLTALLVIAARQVIVTLLIIVAPLAILAWILPNTEQWFTKWRKLFTTMLLMFPLVMLIFYGSLLMSKLIMVTGSPGGDGDPEVMTNVIALAVLTVPLFSLPFIMKSAGGILDRLGVMVNNRNKGLVDRTRNWSKGQSQREREKNMARLAAADWGKNRTGLRGKFMRGASGGANFVGGYTARRDFKRSSIKTDAERLQQNAIAEQLQADDSRLAARSTLRGDTGRAIARARGVSIQDKAIGEEVSAAKTVIENMQFTNAELSKLATTGTATNISGQSLSGDFYQKAAQQQLVSTGQSAKVHDMLRNSQNMSEDVRGSLAYHIQQNYSTLKAKDHSLNDDALKEALVKGTQIGDTQLQEAAVRNLSGLTKEQMAGQDAKGVEQLKLAIQNGVGKPEHRTKAIQVVQEMLADPQLAGKMNADNEKQFKAILQDQAYSTYQNNINPPNPSGGGGTP